jgi:hypothetical protein
MKVGWGSPEYVHGPRPGDFYVRWRRPRHSARYQLLTQPQRLLQALGRWCQSAR